MSGFLGIDLDAAPGLAASLAAWGPAVGAIVSLVSDGESLCDIPTGVHGELEQIGSDGPAMAAAIESAAAELESFTLDLGRPLEVAATVAAIKNFNGTDNDPRLDELLRQLNGLVAEHTTDDAQRARVVQQLLAGDEPLDVRFSDFGPVAEARAEVDRLNDLAERGAISDNDPRLDDALRNLREAVDGVADDPDSEIIHRLITEGEVAVPTIIAAAVTGYDDATVDMAHRNGLEYVSAHGIGLLAEVDRLSESIAGAPPSTVDVLAGERHDAIVELAGTDDPVVIATALALIGEGMPAADAFRQLGSRMATDAVDAQIDAVADQHGVDRETAEERLADMQATTADLVDRGWDVEDAAVIVNAATAGGMDLDMIESVAAADDSSLVEAAQKINAATALAMSTAEFDAFNGLEENFAVFDVAQGGGADQLVSLADIQYVVDNPDDPRFSPALVAIAAAIIDTPTLRNRLDTGRSNNDVVQDTSFGDLNADDHKYSLEDLEAFKIKQQVNFLLNGHLDGIDVAAQGGDLSLVDNHRSREDFEVFLNDNRANLSAAEVAALEVVVDAEWYDKGWVEENKGNIALAAAVVAGAGFVIVTGGLGTGVSGFLITTAAAGTVGATAAGVTTLGINLGTDEDWDDDLLANSAQGFLAGAGSGGGVAGISGFGQLSVAGKALAALGGVSDVTGLASMGAFDVGLQYAPGLGGDNLDDTHRVAGLVSLGTGVPAAVGGLGMLGRSLLDRLSSPAPVGALDEFADAPIFDFALEQLPGAPARIVDGVVPLPEGTTADVLMTPKGSRPDPSTYMSPAQIDAHLALFDDGAVRITDLSAIEKYGTAGPPGGFVMPKTEFDRLVLETGGDLSKLEDALGLNSGSLSSGQSVAVHVDPDDLNGLRLPSGNEGGVNDQWLPGGYTSGGVPEAVLDLDDVPFIVLEIGGS